MNNNIIKQCYPVVLSIAGSDSGGGAGIQADIKTITSLGAYGATAITALTSQNTCGVRSIMPVPDDVLRSQMEAVMDDICIDAVKTGMLHNGNAVSVVAQCIRRYAVSNVVVDPVMVATSGDSLSIDDMVDAMKNELFPLATIITPNMKEAENLLKKEINTLSDMKLAAMELLSYSCFAVLLKGGHMKGEAMTDVFISKEMSEPLLFESEKIETKNLHGTGCTLSSAIATFLALGKSLPDAVKEAKIYINNAIYSGKDIMTGNGNGPLNHIWNPQPMHFIQDDRL